MRTSNNDVLSLIRNIHTKDNAIAIFQEKDKIENVDEFIKLPHKPSILKLFYMSLPMMYIFPKLAWGFFLSREIMFVHSKQESSKHLFNANFTHGESSTRIFRRNIMV